jgi:dinuclear metal center YbgI/SA1388 family protein
MKLQEICNYLGNVIPLDFQESYDNSGLQVGSADQEITSALISLDVTEAVIEECVRKNCNLIVSHHPVIFNPIKKLTGSTLPERIILRAVRSGIAIYSMHTNLDAAENGVSRKMAEKMGLTGIRVLSPLKDRLLKLVTFVPDGHLDDVRNAVFGAGAGVIGNYDLCGYCGDGTGSYRPGENTDPYTGEKGKMHFEKETRFETILFSHMRGRVIEALLKSHPYEEPAYDIYPLANDNINAGFGCIGELPEALGKSAFLRFLSGVFDAKGIRYSGGPENEISRVAVCGGAGSGMINDAAASGADAYVTADLKYHNFLENGEKLLLVDCGHYETEKYAIELIHDLIIKKFPTFALRFSETNSNPINYL